MNELISIIVPIYKVEKYLSRCVSSIINQTYKKLEIILVNDGSPDNCGRMCDEFSKIDNRIKVIHKKNGGLSDARNAGLKIASGIYVSFLDSDDWIDQTYIEKLYKLLIESNADISVCNFKRTSDENCNLIQSKGDVYEFTNKEALQQFYGEFSSQLFVAWGKLYKATLFKNIMYPYGKIHEDDFTTYKLLYIAQKIVLTTEQLIYYWQRNDSIMGMIFNPKHTIDLLEAYEERAQFLLGIGMENISHKTYKSIFFLYLKIYFEDTKFNKSINLEKYKLSFKNLKFILRKTKQDSYFKVFYELFYTIPFAIKIFYKVSMFLKLNLFFKKYIRIS